MPRKRYQVVLDPSVVEDVKARLGDTSFSRFTERALEAALDTTSAPSSRGAGEPAGSPSPASPRASEPVKKWDDLGAHMEAYAGYVDKVVAPGRHCERCGTPITSPSLTRHPQCGGKIVPPPP